MATSQENTADGAQPKTDAESAGFLEDIAQDFSADDKSGPKVKTELAKMVTTMLKSKMSDTKLTEKQSQHPRPENCESMTGIRVNPEIWGKIHTPTKREDLKFQKLQAVQLTALCL